MLGIRTISTNKSTEVVAPFAGWFVVGGLMFAKPDGSSGNFNGGLSYAASSTEGGYTGWRMPTVTELQTLIAKYPGTVLIAAGWPSNVGDWFWVREAYNGSNNYVWSPGASRDSIGTPSGFSYAPPSGGYRWMLVRNT